MSERLKTELAVFERHREAWERDHLNRYVVVRGEDVVGFYDTFDLAATDALKRFGPSDVLIRRVGEKPVAQLSPAVLHGLTISQRVHRADLSS